ncbi:hypothetical protein ACFSJ3_06920 [Corallincola platygyrae]|uniref:PEP-CTERM sorting domain-containing protein n=1 Tax=Corallincola platygyrae TaxID=1193278 RepID=A0ABW4XMI8_9GAMM
MLRKALITTLLLPFAVNAAPLSMDLDSLVHGEIVTDQFAGVTVTGDNPNRDFDHIIAFDTNMSNTRDDDLESPWSGGNLPTDTDMGKILIFAENDNGAEDNVIDTPDDEGSRQYDLTMSFQFDFDLKSFSFVLVDVEGPEEYGYFASFYNGDTLIETVGFEELVGNTGPYGSNAVFGNNTINRINPITAEQLGMDFNRVDVVFGGSGGIGDISYEVPAPAMIGLFSLALIAVGFVRRK